jgi:uncharacterized membrane protein YfcA
MLKQLAHSSEIRFRDVILPTLRLTRGRTKPLVIPAATFIAVSRATLFLVAAIAATALVGWLTTSSLHPLVVLAVAAGALVAGLAGFAFSAVAGALVMHWVPPISIVPVLLACSITTQLFSIAKLHRTMEWRRTAPFLIGGFLGIPLGAALLRDTDPHRFAVSFGAFLIVYGIVMLLRPGIVIASPGRRGGRLADAACGIIGGITGGAIAFPGAAPAIWCGLRGLSKEVQRGIVQPFILVMQIATLAYFSRLGILTEATIASAVVCVPAVLFGTWLGLRLFAHIDDATFRRVVLIFLIVSGASLIL